MAAKRITLDGKVLDAADEYGDWGVHTMEGWWDSPAEKTQETARAQADGDYDLPVLYEARYVTITGIFIADNEHKMFQGMKRFGGLLRTRGRLQVAGYGEDQWADVVRASGFPITPVTDRICRWQVRVKAPDSRKFGLQRSEELVGGLSRSLYHYGNYSASPVVVINGPVTGGYTLSSNDGRQYRVNSGINSGSTHTVDMNDGLLRVNGQVQSGLVGRADIWDIPPGKILNMALVADSGAATGEVLITDTYI